MNFKDILHVVYDERVLNFSFCEHKINLKKKTDEMTLNFKFINNNK